jgi:phosphoglycerate dehydrogenase-like enzyme
MSLDGDPDVVVLGEGVHGMPTEEYARALRERLPDLDVRVARTRGDERALVRAAPVATARTIDEDVLAATEDLRLFACAYAGYDHLPIDALAEAGATVTTASGVHGPNVAEYVLGALLSFVRRFPEARRRQERREWRHYQAHELAGSTVTVVGLGAIGTAIAERLAAFDVTLLGVRSSPERGGPVDEVFGPDGFQEALGRSEYLVLACPLTDATRGLVDGEAITSLGPEGVLVNVARGPVVDTDDVLEALRSNRLRGAALDVTDPEPLPEDHPLWTFGNVMITPHNAGHTPNYYERLAEILAENLRRVEETGEWTGLRNQVVP